MGRNPIPGVGLPQAHHEALSATDVGVRPGADLSGRPEAVEACRVLPGGAEAGVRRGGGSCSIRRRVGVGHRGIPLLLLPRLWATGV